jgi:putative phage-type endonuclease
MLTVNAPAAERIIIPQDSSAWIKSRLGHLTASRMNDVLAFSKRDGKPLKARCDYAIELVAERMTDSAVDHWVSDDMVWGTEQEPNAKLAYTEVTGRAVLPSGFMLHPTLEYCGATPDGFVGHDGLIEIKCPRTTTHIAWMLVGEVPEQHRAQMALQLLVSGRQWCDFVSFDPRVPARQRVFLRRFEPSQAYLDEIEQAATEFLAEVDALFEKVTTSEAMAQ